jgi:hypothetical protein
VARRGIGALHGPALYVPDGLQLDLVLLSGDHAPTVATRPDVRPHVMPQTPERGLW